MKTNKSKRPQIQDYAKLAVERYTRMSKKEKTYYLKALATDCEVSGQHARRVMNELMRGVKKVGTAKRGRKPIYNDDTVVWWLQSLWVDLNYPNTKLMPVMLKEWLNYFKHPDFTNEVREKLLQMSTGTMESLLKSYKREHGKKHFAATKGRGRLQRMYVRVPQRELNFKINVCGYFEGDTVAHCGDRLMGRHAWTLNTCCMHSGWTESEAFLGKEEESILASIVLMRARLPFAMKGWHSDCGSEFLNDTIASYLENPLNYVVQTHGRAYKKNDQARVEQKNWTQVRQSFGYDRVEEQRAVDCMNDIYRNELRVLRNFFTPTQKQKSKIRVNSKYKRKFEIPKTPYDRVMEDPSVSQNIKDKLRAEKELHNPFEVKKRLDEKLKFFERLLQNQKQKSETHKSTSNVDTKEAA